MNATHTVMNVPRRQFSVIETEKFDYILPQRWGVGGVGMKGDK